MKVKSATRRYTQSLRAQSARATGERIVDAFLGRLMKGWYDEITLDRVAEDAGVTVQTVLRRFDGKEGLLAVAVQTLAVQINARRGAPSGDIGCLIDNLIEDYEQTGDTVIRLLALEPRHPGLKKVLDFGRNEHRDWTANAFAEPLGKVTSGDCSAALDALIIATDVYTWKLLRRDLGHSVSATASTMRFLVHSTIDRLTKTNSTN